MTTVEKLIAALEKAAKRATDPKVRAACLAQAAGYRAAWARYDEVHGQPIRKAKVVR